MEIRFSGNTEFWVMITLFFSALSLGVIGLAWWRKWIDERAFRNPKPRKKNTGYNETR